jgi:hypothetical protein
MIKLNELMMNNKRIYLEVFNDKIIIHVKTKGKDFGRIKGYKPVEVVENNLQIDELVTELRKFYFVNYLEKGGNILLIRNFKNKEEIIA